MAICQKCKKNPAKLVVKKIADGHYSEILLCEICAEQKHSDKLNEWKGIASPFDIFGNIFYGLGNYGKNMRNENLKICPKCLTSYAELEKHGRIGCAECYNVFDEELEKIVSSIHGKASNKEKSEKIKIKSEKEKSDKSDKIDKTESEINNKILNLRRKLEEAVLKENFEEAAKIRDEIKAAESMREE